MKLNRIITDYFCFLQSDRGDASKLLIKPGVDLLVATLVRSSAHEVLIPYAKPIYGLPLETVIRGLPRSLANRIKVVDKNLRTRRRVERFLEPIQDGGPFYSLAKISAFGILYKLILGMMYEAEVDIPSVSAMHSRLDILASILHGEAKARIEQVIGLWNLYDTVGSVPVPILKTESVRPTMYERITDLLDEAEMQSYSEQRHLLGIPSRFKIAFLSLKMWSRHFRSNPRFTKYLTLASDSITVASSYYGLPLTVPELAAHSRSFCPPIVDLDLYRFKIARGNNPRQNITFVLPGGDLRIMGPMKTIGGKQVFASQWSILDKLENH